MNKNALITGVTGQDGAYLAKFLLDKGYKVYGLVAGSRPGPSSRVTDPGIADDIGYIGGDLTGACSAQRAVIKSRPPAGYNVGAQSSAGRPWGQRGTSAI